MKEIKQMVCKPLPTVPKCDRQDYEKLIAEAIEHIKQNGGFKSKKPQTEDN